MNHNSHRQIAVHLSHTFLQQTPKLQKKLFFLGCLIPDKNPATYLKGSIRHGMLRGHNWQNAKDYIEKISDALEKKDRFTALDYYTLGKLIHYVSDAFTYAHNSHFTGNLSEHRKYEAQLDPCICQQCTRSLLITELSEPLRQILQHYRLAYLHTGSDSNSDAAYIHKICSVILLRLHEKFA